MFPVVCDLNSMRNSEDSCGNRNVLYCNETMQLMRARACVNVMNLYLYAGHLRQSLCVCYMNSWICGIIPLCGN